MADPSYAQEEQLRRGPGGAVIAVDSSKGLTLDGLLEHLGRLDAIAPPGPVERIACKIARMRAQALTRAALTAHDRLTRGWSEQDTWNLDRVLAGRTGEQLQHLSENAHGWPDQMYPKYEDWVQALAENGAALLAYATEDGVPELEAAHSQATGERREMLRDAIAAREAELASGARTAWHWVAEHHTALWD